MLCAKSSPRGRLSFPGGGGAPYHGLYGEALPGKDTFFRIQVYERVGISIVEVYEIKGNLSFRSVKGPKGLTDHFMDVKETGKLPGLLIYSC